MTICLNRFQTPLRRLFAEVRSSPISFAQTICSSRHARSHQAGPAVCTSKTLEREELHCFTRTRFLQNEAEEMAARYTPFHMEELGEAAAKATKSSRCVAVEKYPDGMHNKALLLTMDDGQQVVAKIPNPIAGQPHYTTASEAATMEYMGAEHSIPVPRVLAWCSRAQDSPVAAEYIIMEKASGVSLQSVWSSMDLKQRFEVVKELVSYQMAWSEASYSGYGSIYYSSDLPTDQQLPLQPQASADSKFVLGPTTGREWQDYGRQMIPFDRGPWQTVEAYLEAIGNRELVCIRDLPRLPTPQITLCGPGSYRTTRDKKARAVVYYLQAVRALMPLDSLASKPSAWHADLHTENIFVDPLEPTKITSIIDWQSTEVSPLMYQAGQPHIISAEAEKIKGTEIPELPPNFEELSLEDQKNARRLFNDRCLCVAYRRWIQMLSPDLWKCLEFQDSTAFSLLTLGRSLLVDGEAIYSSRIAHETQDQAGVLRNSGISIPQQTLTEIDTDARLALYGINVMAEFRKEMGDLFPERGSVRTDEYDEVKAMLRHFKQLTIERLAKNDAERTEWEACWPFDD